MGKSGSRDNNRNLSERILHLKFETRNLRLDCPNNQEASHRPSWTGGVDATSREISRSFL